MTARQRSLGSWVPAIPALRAYQRAWLPRDLVAAIVLSALLVPQGMAYAELAGLPAITGLYTTVVCLLAYAVFGPSPYLVLGPDSSLGPIIAAIILPLAAGLAEAAVGLAGMLALIVGAIAIGAGVARLGFISDLLSQPVRLGYMAGLAATIVASQLPPCSASMSTAATSSPTCATSWPASTRRTPPPCGIGRTGARHHRRAAPHPAAGAGHPRGGRRDDGPVDDPRPGGAGRRRRRRPAPGLPLPSLPAIDLADLPLLIGGAIGITLVAIGDTVSVSSGFAARRARRWTPTRRSWPSATANVAAGFFSGFPVSTSSSRTAVAEQAGAKSQLTGLFAALLVLAMLLLVPGLVQWLPMPVLAAVIIVAAHRCSTCPALRRLWIVRRSDFAIAALCFLGVALVGVLEGIVVAVVVSVARDLHARVAALLGGARASPTASAGFHDLSRYPDAEAHPGIVILRWDAPLFFANSNVFRDAVRHVVAEHGPAARLGRHRAPSPITDIDTTAADMLVKLDEELNADGRHLVFAELKDPVTRQARALQHLRHDRPGALLPDHPQGRRGLPSRSTPSLRSRLWQSQHHDERLPARRRVPHAARIHADRAERQLDIEWQDGHHTVYDFTTLRWLCPCAFCRGEAGLPGLARLGPHADGRAGHADRRVDGGPVRHPAHLGGRTWHRLLHVRAPARVLPLPGGCGPPRRDRSLPGASLSYPVVEVVCVWRLYRPRSLLDHALGASADAPSDA